jgi:RNA polymerase sigma-70 factor (ECF subfamily)
MDDWLLRVRRKFLVRSPLVDTFTNVADLEQDDFLDALSSVVHAERAALVRVATRQGVSVEDALECVQDALCTFLKMQRLGELQAPREEWGRLLGGIVRNAARNRRRRHGVARPHQASVDERPSEAETADAILIRADQHIRLRVCVAELCEIQRAVIMLRLLEEQPGEDVAQSLGISRGHVDVLTHRAKASLRACMLRETTP